MAVCAALVGGCVVAIDVAKEKLVVAIGALAGEVVRLFGFRHPSESALFIALLGQLRDAGHACTVLLEPTGTYGDSLRAQVVAHGHAVSMVQPKHTHDAHELIDGVPSTHDAKAAITMLYLHKNGHSRAWREPDEQRREARALLSRCAMHQRDAEQRYGMLEAMLARHWPEFGAWLDARRQRSALALLREFQCPAAVAQDPAGAERCLRRASLNQLSDELIAGVLRASCTSLGVPMLSGERALVRELIEEIERHEGQIVGLERQLKELLLQDNAFVRMSKAAGVVTAAAVIALLGSPKNYPAPRALLKAAGMNLREHSSGEHESPLSISKRGPALVRKLLYFSALRWIQRDPIARAWYEKRRAFLEEHKTGAVIALARKLLSGLYRVAKYDEEFDSRKLFDTRRLVVKDTPQRPKQFPKRTEPRSSVRRSHRRAPSDAQQGGAHS